MPAIFKTKLPNYPSPPTPSPSLLGEGENTIYNFRMTKMDSMVKARHNTQKTWLFRAFYLLEFAAFLFQLAPDPKKNFQA